MKIVGYRPRAERGIIRLVRESGRHSLRLRWARRYGTEEDGGVARGAAAETWISCCASVSSPQYIGRSLTTRLAALRSISQ